MLTIAEIQDLLSHVTYKPGWAISIREGWWEGVHLTIQAKVANGYSPDTTVDLDVHTKVPPVAMRDWDHFTEFLQWRLIRLEVHECMEFLHFDGRPIFDPHRPNADRDEAPY